MINNLLTRINSATVVLFLALSSMLATTPLTGAQVANSEGSRARITDTGASETAIHLKNMYALLLEIRIELQQEKVLKAEEQLKSLEQEQLRLSADERNLGSQAAEVTQMLASSQLDPVERPNLESVRAELSGSAVEQVRSAQASVTKRRAELQDRLTKERQFLQTLSARQYALHQSRP